MKIMFIKDNLDLKHVRKILRNLLIIDDKFSIVSNLFDSDIFPKQ